MKLLVFVPAYNEEASILKVAEDIRENAPFADYIVIDDCSTDNTREVCEKNEIPYISLPINLGLDGVFQTGMRYAYENGYDAAMPIDGDGQHNAVYIASMMDELNHDNDIIIGSRFLNTKKGGSLRMFGSGILTLIFKIVCGANFTDPTSGMRLVNRNVMGEIATNPNCGPEPDTWAYFVKNGAKLTEVPVEMNERQYGESYFTPVKSAFYMLRMCVSLLLITPFRRRRKL